MFWHYFDLDFRFYNFLGFIFSFLFLMQDDFHFGKDTIVDRTSDVTFIVVSIVARIGVHPTHDGFTIVVLSF